MTEPKRPTTEITLLERSYAIACAPEEQDKLERAARYLDRAMQGIHSRGRVIDREKIAIMAALNIAHELLEALDDQRAGEESLNELNARLEKALDAMPAR
ncbi:cell division protein ZapA [Halomonas rhizosphaerae]|uniref:Cell division protein ZapA n=1 Tax=Halomonas rhizosphaerae TaxID=3043296 RepID=A0ABT6UWB2_9GAMM|nr:cell division protein ZapA [Halomonas rhizosphaerae]MDI5889850.1 cell division protein ZapA [Halomonas rhizosphaerae]